MDAGLHAVLISRRSRPETIGGGGLMIEDVRELITLLKTEF